MSSRIFTGVFVLTIITVLFLGNFTEFTRLFAQTLDTTAPTITSWDVQPRITSTTTSIISFTVTDSGGSHINRVEAPWANYNPTTCTATINTGCTWFTGKTLTAPIGLDTWTSTIKDSMSVGSVGYVYGLNVYDNAGKKTTEPFKIEVTREVTPPTVSISSPTTDTTYTSTQTVVISANASDNIAVTKVEFYDGASLKCTDFTAPYSCSWIILGTDSNGTHIWTAKGFDALGNIGISSAVALTLNLSKPTVSITGPVDGTTYNSGQTVTITASATDSLGITKVEFYRGTTVWCTDTVAPYTCAWSFSNTATQGVYVWTAKATNTSGATAITSPINLTFSLDPTPPTISSWDVQPRVTATTSNIISFTVNDSGGSHLSKVEVLWARYDPIGCTATINTGCTTWFTGKTLTAPTGLDTWTSTVNDTMTVGSIGYVYGMVVYDNAGKKTTEPFKIEVLKDAIPPTVSIFAPTDGTTYSNTQIVDIFANALDEALITKVEFFQGDTLRCTDTTIPYSCRWVINDNTDSGPHSWIAKAYDTGGNTATSSPINLIVRLITSQLTVSITSPADGTRVGLGKNVSIQAYNMKGTIKKVEFYKDDTLFCTSTNSIFPSCNWSITSTTTNGTHTWTAKAFNSTGETATSTPISLIVDTGLPTVSITSPTDGTEFTATSTMFTSIPFNVEASDDVKVSRVTFYNGATSKGSDLLPPYGYEWRISQDGVSNGAYTWTAKVEDSAGNTVTSLPINLVLKVPTLPPTVSIVSPTEGGTVYTNGSFFVSATSKNSVKLEIYNNGVLKCTKSGFDVGSGCSIGITASTAGTHVLTAKAYNADGEVTTSSPASVNVVYDNTDPVVTWDVQPRLTTEGLITATFTATDSGGSHLYDASLVRAPYDAEDCTAVNRTRCFWEFYSNSPHNGTEHFLALAPTSTDNWTGSIGDNISSFPTNSSFVYGLNVRDKVGNATTSNYLQVTFGGTPLPDATPPTIANVEVLNITNTSATITWTTNSVSDSEVQLASGPCPWPSVCKKTTLTTTHSIDVQKLTPNTTYTYTIKSRNAGGQDTSVPLSFKTKTQEVFIEELSNEQDATVLLENAKSAGFVVESYVYDSSKTNIIKNSAGEVVFIQKLDELHDYSKATLGSGFDLDMLGIFALAFDKVATCSTSPDSVVDITRGGLFGINKNSKVTLMVKPAGMTNTLFNQMKSDMRAALNRVNSDLDKYDTKGVVPRLIDALDSTVPGDIDIFFDYKIDSIGLTDKRYSPGTNQAVEKVFIYINPDNLRDASAGLYDGVGNVFTHEVGGHAYGVSHSSVPGNAMSEREFWKLGELSGSNVLHLTESQIRSLIAGHTNESHQPASCSGLDPDHELSKYNKGQSYLMPSIMISCLPPFPTSGPYSANNNFDMTMDWPTTGGNRGDPYPYIGVGVRSIADFVFYQEGQIATVYVCPMVYSFAGYKIIPQWEYLIYNTFGNYPAPPINPDTPLSDETLPMPPISPPSRAYGESAEARYPSNHPTKAGQPFEVVTAEDAVPGIKVAPSNTILNPDRLDDLFFPPPTVTNVSISTSSPGIAGHTFDNILISFVSDKLSNLASVVSSLFTHNAILSLADPEFIADGLTSHTITVTAFDESGVNNINQMQAIINRQGENTGSYGGYMAWNKDASPYTGGKDPRSCTGGGFAAVNPEERYNPSYLTLDSCAVTNSGNSKTVTFTIRFNPSFKVTGTNTVSGSAYNGMGSLGWKTGFAGSNFTLFIDTTPPSVSIISPMASSTITAIGIGNIVASATDDTGVAGVQFKVDGINLSAEVTTSSYTVSLDTTKITSKTHIITATARDAVGNMATSSSLNLNTKSTSSAYFSYPTTGKTVGGVIPIILHVSNTEKIAGVQFQLDGNNVGPEDTTSAYAFGTTVSYNGSLDTTTIPTGSRILSAIVRDFFGFKFTTKVTVNVIRDITPPTVSITAPANNTMVSGNNTIVSVVTSDNVGTVLVELKLDGVNIKQAGGTPYALSFSHALITTTLTNGSHILTAVARDSSGNIATSTPITITVNNAVTDTTSPTVSLTSPLNNTTASGTAVSVKATSTDNVGVSGVQFKLDGLNLGTEDTSSPYSISWNTASSTNTAHTLLAVARDAKGNRATSSPITVNVSNVVPDTIKPVVSISSPLNNASVTGKSSVSINTKATDDRRVEKIQIYIDNVLKKSCPASSTTNIYTSLSCSYTWSLSNVSSGKHTIQAKAYDSASSTANVGVSSVVTVTK